MTSFTLHTKDNLLDKIRNLLKIIKHNRKKVILGLLCFLIVFIAIFIFINLTNPTKINKYITHVVNKGNPANDAFSDENFYNLIIDAYNKKNNTSLPYSTNLTDEQLAEIDSLFLVSKQITNASGIEKLTFLTDLNLSYNQLTSIDLSKNTALTGLSLGCNQLTSIDLSNNTALTELYLYKNQLTNIELSKNTALTDLHIYENQLMSVDLKDNTALTSLSLDYNQLTSIDLSKNTALTYLGLSANQLTSIDLSNNTALTFLRLNNNQLTSIDLSKNTALTELYLFQNQLASIDLSKNTALTDLDLSGSVNQLTSIDLSKNTALTKLRLSANQLTSIDLSKNAALTYLHLSHNQLTSIDLSNNTALTDLYLEDCNFINNLYLRKNQTYTFPIILPEQLKNRYVISDGNIASFDNNIITGLKAGITSTTLNSTISNTKINVYDITSKKYIINYDEKYIYTKADTNQNTILSNINIEYINGKIENNKLILYHDDIIEEEYTIINASSDIYDLNKDYIYLGTDSLDTTKINVSNGTFEVSNDVVTVKHNEKILDTYKIVSVSSNTYDLTKDYIYNINNSFNKEDITCINCVLKEESGKLNIYVNNTKLDSFNIINITIESTKYDLAKDYIYLKTGDMDLNEFNNDNVASEVTDNKLYLKHGEDILKIYKIIKLTSTKYDLTKEYINAGLDTFDKTKINIINGTLEEKDNSLNVKYNNNIIDTYKIVSYKSDEYNLAREYIYLGTNSFDANKITCNNCTLEQFNNILKIKYNSEILKELKFVSVSSNVYDLTKDNIKVTKESPFNINNVNVVNGVKEYVDNKLYIKYNDDVLKVYTISTRAKGDVTGDDKVNLSDVTKLFKYVRKKITLDEESLEVSDVTGDGKVTLSDVTKLFKYVRGKINTL